MSLMDTFTQFFTNETMREEATKVVVDGLWATGEAALEAAQQNAYGLAIGTTVVVGLGTAALAARKYGLPTLPSFRNTRSAPTSTDTQSKKEEKETGSKHQASSVADTSEPRGRTTEIHDHLEGEENAKSDRSRTPSPTRK